MTKVRQDLFSTRGRCPNDVSTEGEGGGQPNSDKRKGGCVNLVLTRGGRGSKIPKIQKTSYVNRPIDYTKFQQLVQEQEEDGTRRVYDCMVVVYYFVHKRWVGTR